jgi:hypothetical protein
VSPASAPDYRRLLLDFAAGGIDRAALRAAADLARLLDVEMLGLFIEDQSMVGAANLPFLRELRMPMHEWQPVSSETLALELRLLSEQARMVLVEEGAAVGARCRFEVRRGDPATAVAGLCSFQDIIAVTEPADAVEWLTGTADRARKAALSSEAAVLLLPARPSSPPGPIVAIAENYNDSALLVAARIAAASNQTLIVAALGSDHPMTGMVRAAVEATGLPSNRVEVLSLGGSTMHSIKHALGGRRGRFLVTSRDQMQLTKFAPERLATELGMPVLLIERISAAA